MKAYIVGDTHGKLDLAKLNPENLKSAGITERDILIHLGDIGVPAFGTDHDEVLEYYRSLPFETIVNLGNHENYRWILKQPLIKKYGVNGYQLGERLFAPLLGEIITLGTKRFWFYPGGYSIDYRWREWGHDIYVEELPTKETSDQALQKLRASGGVDIIISHDGPRHFVMKHFGFPIQPQSEAYTEKSSTTEVRIHPGLALDEIYREPHLYNQWFFGHHHRDFCHQQIFAVFDQLHVVDLGVQNDA